jgi:hypothetical protein
LQALSTGAAVLLLGYIVVWVVSVFHTIGSSFLGRAEIPWTAFALSPLALLCLEFSVVDSVPGIHEQENKDIDFARDR